MPGGGPAGSGCGSTTGTAAIPVGSGTQASLPLAPCPLPLAPCPLPLAPCPLPLARYIGRRYIGSRERVDWLPGLFSGPARPAPGGQTRLRDRHLDRGALAGGVLAVVRRPLPGAPPAGEGGAAGRHLARGGRGGGQAQEGVRPDRRRSQGAGGGAGALRGLGGRLRAPAGAKVTMNPAPEPREDFAPELSDLETRLTVPYPERAELIEEAAADLCAAYTDARASGLPHE